ncbi:MAG: SH3 domain-containing protein [Lachnospiraceae bacterium]|nr:SH3 domain-containing protein [Lachnospiraceae bacterium]
MKKLICLAVTLFMLSISTCVYAQVTVTQEVNLRSGPGLKYDIVDSVPAGTVLQDNDSIMADERSVYWYAVIYKGQSCWVSSKFSEITGSDYEAQPLSDDTPETPASTESSSGSFTTTADVNLREGPGISYDILSSVKTGTSLKGTGSSQTDDRGVKWYQVTYNGTKCWVSSKFVTSKGTDTASVTPSSGDPELASYCNKSLKNAADAVGLSNRETVSGEYSYAYYGKRVILMGNSNLSYIELIGPGCTIYGAKVGMKHFDAANACLKKGLRMVNLSSENFLLEHYASGSSSPDSSLLLYFDTDGTVTSITWNSYSS